MLGIAFLAAAMVFSYSMTACVAVTLLWWLLDRALDDAERRRSRRRAHTKPTVGARAPVRTDLPRRHQCGPDPRSRTGATAVTTRAGQRTSEPSALRHRAASGPSPRRR